MKKIYILLISSFILLAGFISPHKNINKLPTDFINIDGKTLVIKKGCTLCHHTDKKIVGPSLKDISSKYESNMSKILNFLEGKSDPIVQPEEFQYMKPVLNQLKHASKEEREAIAKYIAGLK